MSTETPAPLAAPFVITEPGVYDGVPAETYHGDPVPGRSLSSTGIRKLTEHTPAHFKEWRDHPPATTPTFNFGHAAHKEVLGEGAEMITFPKHDARTKEGKVIRADLEAAVAAGKIAVTEQELATVKAMAKAIQGHSLAMSLLDPSSGKSEQALFWKDPETGTWLRALVDRLREPKDGRLIGVDYKTADSADPEDFGKAAANYGYHQQDRHYSSGIRALGLAEDVPFVFVVQEKKAPYLVNVIQLDILARKIGAHLNRKAIDLYTDCVRTDHWPGYPEEVALTPLPHYIERQYEEIV